MKHSGWLNTAALSMFLGTFLLGTTALLRAQEQREEAKPAQPEAAKPSQQDEHSSRPEDAKPSKQQDLKKQDEDKQNADKPARNDDKATKQDRDVRPQNEKEGNERNEQNQQTAQRMQGKDKDNGRGRIPDDKFRANFGHQHTFVVQRPTVVQGRPTFQYSGYSFALVNVWPTDWAYTDQCYIDYIDGDYFLFDLAHPGIRLAIVVVM
jgi:hypothetical protein